MRNRRWLKKEEGVPDLAIVLETLKLQLSPNRMHGSTASSSKDKVTSATDSAFGIDDELQRIDFISNLPTEISISILCYIHDMSDFLSLPLVCRSWAELTRDNDVWKALYMKKWGGLPKSFVGRKKKMYPKRVNWRSLFEMRLKLRENWKKGLVSLILFSSTF